MSINLHTILAAAATGLLSAAAIPALAAAAPELLIGAGVCAAGATIVAHIHGQQAASDAAVVAAAQKKLAELPATHAAAPVLGAILDAATNLPAV